MGSAITGLLGGLTSSLGNVANQAGTSLGQGVSSTGDPFNTGDPLSITGATDPNAIFAGALGPAQQLSDIAQSTPAGQAAIADPSGQTDQSQQAQQPPADQTQQPATPPQQSAEQQAQIDDARASQGLPPAGPTGFQQQQIPQSESVPGVGGGQQAQTQFPQQQPLQAGKGGQPQIAKDQSRVPQEQPAEQFAGQQRPITPPAGVAPTSSGLPDQPAAPVANAPTDGGGGAAAPAAAATTDPTVAAITATPPTPAERTTETTYPSQAWVSQGAGQGGQGGQGAGQQGQNPLANMLHSKGGQAALGLLIGGLLSQLFGGRRGGGFGGGWGRRGVSPGFNTFARAAPPGIVHGGSGWNTQNIGNMPGGLANLGAMATMATALAGGGDQQGQGGGQPGGQPGADPNAPDSNPPTGPGGPATLGGDTGQPPGAQPLPQTAGPAAAPPVDHTGVPTQAGGAPRGGTFMLNPNYNPNNPQSPRYVPDPNAPAPQAQRGTVQSASTDPNFMPAGSATAALTQGFDHTTGATDPGVRTMPDGGQQPTNGMPGGTTTNAPPPSAGYGAIPDQQNRPKWYRGKLDAFGGKWDFGSGGGQFASLPFGTYHLYPGAVGPTGQRIGAAAGISDSNNPGDNTVHDPLYRGGGGTHARAGVELHPDVSGQLRTNGCIGISRGQWSSFNQKFRAAAAQGPLTLTVGPQGASIQSANAPRPPADIPNTNTVSAIPGERYAQADTVDRRSSNDPGLSRGDRNNNPGNIKQGVDSQIYGATGYDRQGHAIFPSWGAGRRAQASMLQRLYNHKTITQMGREYAKDPGWAAGVMKNGGFGSNERLNLDDQNTLDRLQKAIWKQEGTHPPAEKPQQTGAAGNMQQVAYSEMPRYGAAQRGRGVPHGPLRIEPGDVRAIRRRMAPGTKYEEMPFPGGIRGGAEPSQTQV